MDELAVEIRADNQAYYKVKYTIKLFNFVQKLELKHYANMIKWKPSDTNWLKCWKTMIKVWKIS